MLVREINIEVFVELVRTALKLGKALIFDSVNNINDIIDLSDILVDKFVSYVGLAVVISEGYALCKHVIH